MKGNTELKKMAVIIKNMEWLNNKCHKTHNATLRTPYASSSLLDSSFIENFHPAWSVFKLIQISICCFLIRFFPLPLNIIVIEGIEKNPPVSRGTMASSQTNSAYGVRLKRSEKKNLRFFILLINNRPVIVDAPRRVLRFKNLTCAPSLSATTS